MRAVASPSSGPGEGPPRGGAAAAGSAGAPAAGAAGAAGAGSAGRGAPGADGAPAPVCAIARTRRELERHFAIRRAVFVDEQALFPGGDRDAVDLRPDALHAVGRVPGRRIGGTVRLYPLDGDGLWQGDRLAVLPAFRRGLLGATLVRFAVATAGERGGRRMVAMIQLRNVAFFEALGWRRSGEVTRYHGIDHQPMEIGLGPRGS